MNAIVETELGVTLIGAGSATRSQIGRAVALAPVVVAADGGARRALAAGQVPQAVIGDMDSAARLRGRIPDDRFHAIDEQDSTDFEKCLATIRARFILALGVTGARIDHTLASMTALVRHAGCPVFLLAGRDVVFAARGRISLDLARGTRVSLFPMTRVSGRSEGLAWPIEGLDFNPNGKIGTSNRATGGRVTLDFDAPGMLVILPARHLQAALAAHALSSSAR
jgi:thiamine pyrophosphokinase